MKKLLINKTKNNITVILLEENKIYGYLVLEKLIKYCKSENKAYFISCAAAEKGYGPLLYDTAFYITYNKGLTSDPCIITKAAADIWNYYYTKRKKEFKIIRNIKSEFINFYEKYSKYTDISVTSVYLMKKKYIKIIEDRIKNILISDINEEEKNELINKGKLFFLDKLK